MTSKRQKEAVGPHNDELDVEIDMLLHLYGSEAVREAVARRSEEKPGPESKYLPIAIEEIDIQINSLLSSRSKIKIPTRNSMKNNAISRLAPKDEGALDTGLRRCLESCKELIFIRIDIVGSTGDFSHIRFLQVLEKYASQKALSEAERKFTRSRIACIDEARAKYLQRFGALPADEWSLARIESSIRQSQGALTLLVKQLATEEPKSGSR